MYKEKYLKYKKKYINLCQYISMKKNMVGGEIEFTSIEEGDLLFRCAPNISNLITYQGRFENARLCEDTLKIGLYFANQVLISLAMCIEYDKLIELGVFRVTKEIDTIIKGKYSFRDINPERYFNANGSLIPYVKPLPEENVSHIEDNVQLLGPNKTYLLPENIQQGIDCIGSREIFLSTLNRDHLNNLELVAGFRFNPAIIRTANDLHQYMIRNHFPFDLHKYISDGILIRFI